VGTAKDHGAQAGLKLPRQPGLRLDLQRMEVLVGGALVALVGRNIAQLLDAGITLLIPTDGIVIIAVGFLSFVIEETGDATIAIATIVVIIFTITITIFTIIIAIILSSSPLHI